MMPKNRDSQSLQTYSGAFALYSPLTWTPAIGPPFLLAFIQFSASQILSPSPCRATTLPNTYLVPTSLSAHGVLVICVRWSKTIQYKQRRLLIPVVRVPPGHPLCAVQAYEHHLRCHPASSSTPAFLKSSDGEIKPISYDALGTKLRSVLASVGLDPSKYSTPSLRRGGASYAFKCGAPVELISL